MAMTAWRGEVLDQLDLFIGERANLLAVDPDYPDHFVVLDHRDADQGACAGKLDGGGADPIRVSESGFDVGNLDRSLRFESAPWAVVGRDGSPVRGADDPDMRRVRRA